MIVDGKRNDIGSTAAAYAAGFLGRHSPWGADALTVSPYLGDDSLQPFVDAAVRGEAGIFVLVKTSNPGGRMLQDLVADGRPRLPARRRHVEGLAAATAGACGYGAVGAVVGATYPEQLAELRAEMPHTWFLVPGYGSQGGTAADCRAAFDPRDRGDRQQFPRHHLCPSPASVLGAVRRGRWQAAAEAATRDMIEQLRAVTPAGSLQ